MKKLKKYMINDYDIVLMIVIKKMLNSNARVKYVHHSKYYNPNTIHEMIADFPAGMSENYSFDIRKVLSEKPSAWRSLDWRNVYTIYQVCVRNLIYSKYFLT